jgi:hypothetical protein
VIRRPFAGLQMGLPSSCCGPCSHRRALTTQQLSSPALSDQFSATAGGELHHSADFTRRLEASSVCVHWLPLGLRLAGAGFRLATVYLQSWSRLQAVDLLAVLIEALVLLFLRLAQPGALRRLPGWWLWFLVATPLALHIVMVWLYGFMYLGTGCFQPGSRKIR